MHVPAGAGPANQGPLAHKHQQSLKRISKEEGTFLEWQLFGIKQREFRFAKDHFQTHHLWDWTSSDWGGMGHGSGLQNPNFR